VPEGIPLPIISTIYENIKPASDSFKPASGPFPLSTTQNYLLLHSRSCPPQLSVAAPAPTMTRSAVCRLYTTSTSCRAGAVKQCAYSGRCVISIFLPTPPPNPLTPTGLRYSIHRRSIQLRRVPQIQIKQDRRPKPSSHDPSHRTQRTNPDAELCDPAAHVAFARRSIRRRDGCGEIFHGQNLRHCHRLYVLSLSPYWHPHGEMRMAGTRC
jgi:hypothetical protein